jgi:hypothetical protein
MPQNLDYPKKPPIPYHPLVGHTAGTLRCTWRYGDSMMVGFAQKSIVDLKRRLPQAHICNEATA